MPKTNKDLAYSREHFLERVSERYNISLKGEDYDKINQSVLNQRSETTTTAAVGVELLGKEKEDEYWGVQWPSSDSEEGSVRLVCVWSKADERVTTALPKETVIRERRTRKKN